MRSDRAKVRAVFDCMVFPQGAARRDSGSGACLLLVDLEAIELWVSNPILSEIRDVLTRPQLQKKFPGLTEELRDRFLAALGRRGVLIPDAPRVFVYERDPKDEPYINLAIAAAADYLVSRDNDILALADQTNSDGKRLRRYAPQLRILDPGSFLAEIRGSIEVPGKK